MPKRISGIFTSANGVRCAPSGQDRPAFCVGTRTTQAAQAAGWRARCAGPDADALVRCLSTAPRDLCYVHFSGRYQRGDVAARLRASGLQVQRIVVYDQIPTPLSKEAQQVLRGPGRVIAPLFSPRSAAQFAGFLTAGMAPDIVAMSPAVADALPVPHRRLCRIAQFPTAHAIAIQVEMLVADRSPG